MKIGSGVVTNICGAHPYLASCPGLALLSYRDAIKYGVEKTCNNCQEWPRRNGSRFCGVACRIEDGSTSTTYGANDPAGYVSATSQSTVVRSPPMHFKDPRGSSLRMGDTVASTGRSRGVTTTMSEADVGNQETTIEGQLEVCAFIF